MFTYFYSKSFQSRDKNVRNSHFLHGLMAKNIPKDKVPPSIKMFETYIFQISRAVNSGQPAVMASI